MRKLSEKAVSSQAALSPTYKTFHESNTAMNLMDKVETDYFIQNAVQTSVNVSNEVASIYLNKLVQEPIIQEGNLNYK